jgi:NADH-quinone oxidoreductase subunit J
VVQIIVYAGAIMVLFLFVIMLLGVDQVIPLRDQVKAQPVAAVLLGAGLIAEIVLAVRISIGFSHKALPDFRSVNAGGNVQALAKVLFNSYFFPFEVTSILLIVAAIGAMLHGRRRIGEEETIDVPEPAPAPAPAAEGTAR